MSRGHEKPMNVSSAPAAEDDDPALVSISPAGRPHPRKIRQKRCPVCRAHTPSALYDDAYGNTARIILPHGDCAGRFRIVR